MRRKQVLFEFRKVFETFLLEKGYKFCKNCFLNYSNGILNRVSLYTSIQCGEIEFDIHHDCFVNDQHEYGENLFTCNEDDPDGVCSIAKRNGYIDEDCFTFNHKDLQSLQKSMNVAFSVYCQHYYEFYIDSVEKLKERDIRFNNICFEHPCERIDNLINLDYSKMNSQICKSIEQDVLLVIYYIRHLYYYLIEYLQDNLLKDFDIEGFFNGYKYVSEIVLKCQKSKDLLKTYLDGIEPNCDLSGRLKINNESTSKFYNVFIGTKNIQMNKQIVDLIDCLREDYSYIIYIIEDYIDNSGGMFDVEMFYYSYEKVHELIKKSIKSKKYVNALIHEDQDYLNKIKQEMEIEKNKIIERNMRFLKKYKLDVKY